MPPDSKASTSVRTPTLLETSLSVFLRSLPLKHGAHRILDRLVPAGPRGAQQLVDLPYGGRVVRIDISDLVGWHFLLLRNFDPEVSEIIKRFAGRGSEDVYWDVGANKGAVSYEIASSLPGCKIVAIEPQRSMIELLEMNLGSLAPGRFEVFPVGLSDKPGTFELVIPQGNRGKASLVTKDGGDGSLVEQVEIVTAETVCGRSKFGWPTLVKIDVEGFEPAVIRTLLPAFESRRIRCCVFECHRSEAEGFRAIRDATREFGYRTFAIRKTPFSTRLDPADGLVRGATDYAIVRGDL